MAVVLFVQVNKKDKKEKQQHRLGVRLCNPLEALHLQSVKLIRVPQSDVEICVRFPITTKAKEMFWC